MILRSKISLFAFITSLLGVAIVFRHLTTGKLSIIRVDSGIHPPALAPIPHNATSPTGHTHHDNDNEQGPKVWTQADWLLESLEAQKAERAHLNAKPLEELCAKTAWRDDLIFECLRDTPNTRATVLTCLRYAIDAGAIVYLPMFDNSSGHAADMHTSPSHKNLLFDFSIFDSHHFRAACPGLEIYPLTKTTLEDLGPVSRAAVLHPDDLPHWSLIGNTPVMSVRNYVHRLANANKGIKTLVPFGPVSKYYPVCHDGEAFVERFGQLLPLGDDTHHQLANKILYHLHANHSIPLSPSTTSLSRLSLADKDIPGFLSLRFETPSNWIRDASSGGLVEPTNIPSYEVQRDYFLKRMGDTRHGSHGLKIVYISASEAIFRKFERDTERVFGELAPSKNRITFLRAADFLTEWEEEKELKELDDISRDILDYLVMLRSQYFLGLAESEISWAVANKRRIKSKGGSCGWINPWSSWMWGTAMWDEWSDLMGDRKYEEEWKMWP